MEKLMMTRPAAPGVRSKSCASRGSSESQMRKAAPLKNAAQESRTMVAVLRGGAACTALTQQAPGGPGAARRRRGEAWRDSASMRDAAEFDFAQKPGQPHA